MTPVPSSMPRPATSTRPSPSPATISWPVAPLRVDDAAGVVDREDRTGGGSSAPGGRPSARSSSSGKSSGRLEAVAVLAGLAETGRRRVEQRHSASGRGEVVAVDLRGRCAARMSPRREPGDRRERAPGSSRPSWSRRSSALSRSAGGPLPYGIELARDVGAVDEPGRDGVDGVAPAVGREVGAGDLEHARVVRPGVERRRWRPSSTRGRPRAGAGSP